VSDSSLPQTNTITEVLSWLPDWRVVFVASESSDLPSARPKESLWQIGVHPTSGEPVQKPQRLFECTDFYLHHFTSTSDGKTLAFLKSRAHEDVYVGDLDREGTTLGLPRRFTLDNRNSYPQAWVPHSGGIIFISDRNGKSELFRQSLNETVPEMIVSGAVGDLESGGFSPDGLWILYLDKVNNKGLTHLMRQPTAGGAPELVLEISSPDGEESDFSCPREAGKTCIFLQKEKNDLIFYKLDPIRGKEDLLGRIGTKGFYGFQVAPDGSQLAVVDASHKNRIEILNLSDRLWHEITVETGWGDNQSIAWTADGTGFFLTTWLPQSWNLVHATSSGRAHSLLSNAYRQWMAAPLPSPDGKHLAFQTETIEGNVWLLQNF